VQIFILVSPGAAYQGVGVREKKGGGGEEGRRSWESLAYPISPASHQSGQGMKERKNSSLFSKKKGEKGEWEKKKKRAPPRNPYSPYR